MSPESDTPPEESLDDEIDAALDGINLQEVDLPQGEENAEGAEPAADSGLRRGTVTGVHATDVFVDLGPRMQGVISSSEFDEPPSPGDTFDFTLCGQEDGLWTLSRRDAIRLAAWKDIDLGAVVKAQVTGQNTGGLELSVGPLSAFMPASQASLRRIEDLSSLIGESMVCEVIEFDRSRKRIVLSRRRVLEREAEESRRETVNVLEAGTVVRGRVTRIETYGAFVEISPGVEGLVHVSNISRKRVSNPADVLNINDSVEAQVLEVTEGGKRIGLGMKQLEPDPWDTITDKFRIDQVLTGKVQRLAPFGAFVEIADGVDGLLHISQMGDGQPGTPIHKLASEGQELLVRIQSIDVPNRRLSLSRLDVRGALIGTEDAAATEEIDRILDQSTDTKLGTNLGSLFKKALDDNS